MRVEITDHALLRWLERVHGHDIETMRGMLAKMAQPYVDARVKHAEIGGVWLVFSDARLVTVLPGKPTVSGTYGNDRVFRNGTNRPRQEMPWQGKKRKRNHK